MTEGNSTEFAGWRAASQRSSSHEPFVVRHSHSPHCHMLGRRALQVGLPQASVQRVVRRSGLSGSDERSLTDASRTVAVIFARATRDDAAQDRKHGP